MGACSRSAATWHAKSRLARRTRMKYPARRRHRSPRDTPPRWPWRVRPAVAAVGHLRARHGDGDRGGAFRRRHARRRQGRLQLNGAGLRAVFVIKGYAAGLYLPRARAQRHRGAGARTGPSGHESARCARGAESDSFVKALNTGACARTTPSRAEACWPTASPSWSRTMTLVGTAPPGRCHQLRLRPPRSGTAGGRQRHPARAADSGRGFPCRRCGASSWANIRWTSELNARPSLRRLESATGSRRAATLRWRFTADLPGRRSTSRLFRNGDSLLMHARKDRTGPWPLPPSHRWPPWRSAQSFPTKPIRLIIPFAPGWAPPTSWAVAWPTR